MTRPGGELVLNRVRGGHATIYTAAPILKGHPDVRPTPLERPLGSANFNINVPDKRSPLLQGHVSGEKGVASQEGFHCIESLINLVDHGHVQEEISIMSRLSDYPDSIFY